MLSKRDFWPKFKRFFWPNSRRQRTIFSVILPLAALIAAPVVLQLEFTAAAQSTGDTLPTRAPIVRTQALPQPIVTSTATVIRKVWLGRIVSNTLGATKGEGSIFRVSVEGILDTPIELRTDDKFIVANSGSKPEYGRYAAEFAPVTAGTWRVSVPALGVSLDVVADNYNLAVIEFVQIPEVEATQTVIPTLTPTPLEGINWQGHLLSETFGAAGPGARLLIRVVGRDNHPVRISTISQVINTANTGQKPDELGPNMVEFAGLTPGKYIVEPLGLNAALEVELKPFVETRVEFRPQPVTPTPAATATQSPPLPLATYTPAPLPPTSTPVPTSTPTETASPTPSPLPLPTATLSPSPTPVSHWLGVVESRIETGTEQGSITVRVGGIEGLSVKLYSLSGSMESERRCITGQGGVGQDACIFKELQPDQYKIEPEGLRVGLPVMLFPREAVRADLSVQMLPPGIIGWQGRLNKNSNSFQVKPQEASIITVRVTQGRPGQVIALYSPRGPARFCEVVPNPVLGGLICEFGQLGPGVYTVEAVTTGARFRVFVDGIGEVEVEFSPSAAPEMLALYQSPALVGQGAQPARSGGGAPATLRPFTITSAPPATPSPVPTIPPTPTPALVWQGRIVETGHTGVGAIGVRAAGLKDHPVILRSGNWQSQPQLTGAKVELGEYAVEFGGLAPGEYQVDLVDLAQLSVKLEPGQFLLVEFRYDFANPPGPSP